MDIAIITARGRSKRIPRKNIKDFCGRPIIAYSIEAALKSGLFDKVMVSTDDEEIAGISGDLGAEVPFMRSAKNSDDFATTADVLLEVLENYEKQGSVFEHLCCIYPTAPFITAEKLRCAMEMLYDGVAEYVIPVVKYSYPPQRALLVRDGFTQMQYPQYSRTRSQDLEPVYHDCGQFYCAKASSFLRDKTLVGEKTAAIILTEAEVQDIDTLGDWALAEMKYKLSAENR